MRAPSPLDPYGGRTDRKEKATGFFYPKKLGKRWFLIDPEGHPYLQAGVCSLSRGNSAVNQSALEGTLRHARAVGGPDQRSAAREFLHARPAAGAMSTCCAALHTASSTA